ncbi:MAG: PRC-barrel domain containing protein [Candidatus Limnocylindria bacterium]
MTVVEMWAYGDTAWAGIDLSGFGVEARDGSIGTIDESTNEVDASYLIVDTGPWIFGKKVMLPAGVIERIDETDRKVFVNRTKDEIKNAPELDEFGYHDQAYRDQVGTYYGRGVEGDPTNRPAGPDFGRTDQDLGRTDRRDTDPFS